MNRRGDYIGTFTGKQFWPLDPRPEEVCLEDIAHALSNICRFNGHTVRFYSVAEHSLNVAHFMERYWNDGDTPEMQLYALLHDAAEAYCCDIPRPLKQSLKDYRHIENEIMTAIYNRFGLTEPTQHQQAIISYADSYVLALEAKELMRNTRGWNLIEVDLRDSLPSCWWTDVKNEYATRVSLFLYEIREGKPFEFTSFE